VQFCCFAASQDFPKLNMRQYRSDFTRRVFLREFPVGIFRWELIIIVRLFVVKLELKWVMLCIYVTIDNRLLVLDSSTSKTMLVNRTSHSVMNLALPVPGGWLIVAHGSLKSSILLCSTVYVTGCRYCFSWANARHSLSARCRCWQFGCHVPTRCSLAFVV